ncbi:MAG: type II toxin-antitoxin system RelE/ParE family toxin [Ignavibacteriae bacterium]|nr:type II toxin-antitoxin system RelE/ParE family toxin [Ignavibacteriota bacterium]
MRSVAYEVIIKPSAQRDLDALPRREVERLAKRIRLLSNDPRPFGVQKLSASESYRIRSGSYRILFEIDDKLHKVFIYRVKHRREAYR